MWYFCFKSQTKTIAMKKILFLVILIAQSAYMTFAQNNQNETLTFKEIGTHVESSYRSGSTVYFIYPVTEYKINCGSKTPTEIQICDGISTAAKHVVMVHDTTSSSVENVFSAYQTGQFVETNTTTLWTGIPLASNLGIYSVPVSKITGIVYLKEKNTIIKKVKYEDAKSSQPFFGVMCSIAFCIMFAISLLVRGKEKDCVDMYRSGEATIKWITLAAGIVMLCIAYVDATGKFSLYENAVPKLVAVSGIILLIIFVLYLRLEKSEINYEEKRINVKFLISISLFFTMIAYGGLVGDGMVMRWFVFWIFMLMGCILLFRNIPTVYKWYCEKYPNARFTRFMKV